MPKLNDGLPLTMTDSQRYQVRNARKGLCVVCGDKATPRTKAKKNPFCAKHWKMRSERNKRNYLKQKSQGS